MSRATEIEQLFLDRILYIGDELPSGVADDPRPKFVLLGAPNDLIEALAALLDKVETEARINELERFVGDGFTSSEFEMVVRGRIKTLKAQAKLDKGEL